MPDIAAVLKKLDKQDDRLERIETTIGTIATQSVQIITLQAQTDALWKKYDDAFSMTGPVAAIQNHQASCPRLQISRMWWAVGILWATVITIVWRVAAK